MGRAVRHLLVSVARVDGRHLHGVEQQRRCSETRSNHGNPRPSNSRRPRTGRRVIIAGSMARHHPFCRVRNLGGACLLGDANDPWSLVLVATRRRVRVHDPVRHFRRGAPSVRSRTDVERRGCPARRRRRGRGLRNRRSGLLGAPFDGAPSRPWCGSWKGGGVEGVAAGVFRSMMHRQEHENARDSR